MPGVRAFFHFRSGAAAESGARVLALCALLATAAGCQRGCSSSAACLEPAPPTGSAYRAFPPASAPALKLLSPGSEPRRRARYHFKSGTATDYALESGQGPPGSSPRFDSRVAGHIEVTVGCTAGDDKARLESRSGAVGRAVDQRSVIYEFVTSRGIIDKLGLVVAGASDKALAAAPTPRSPAPLPLPDEPIGVGATWQSVTREPDGSTRTTSYELVSMDGDRLHTRSSIEQLPAPGAPASGPRHGKGEHHVDLGQPLAEGWEWLDGARSASGLKLQKRASKAEREKALSAYAKVESACKRGDAAGAKRLTNQLADTNPAFRAALQAAVSDRTQLADYCHELLRSEIKARLSH